MSSKINKSWEKTRSEIHSPEGVEDLRKAVKYGLTKKYMGLAESMFRYDGMDDRFDDMLTMSQDTVPEVYLMKHGQCVWFSLDGQMHCLPVVFNGGLNIYGKMTSWSPVPVGYSEGRKGSHPETVERIRSLTLTPEDSVVMKNDLFGGGDEEYISKMVDELVDNTMTMNQLQLLAKSPFVFNVTEDNLLSAKNFFLAMSSDRPAIFTNAMGEKPVPVIETTRVAIDPALFELYDRFECQILEYIGFPCVPITKRAQQSVSEVESNMDKIYMRRTEKLTQRQRACDRMNAVFNTSVKCVSILDENITIGEIEDEAVHGDGGADAVTEQEE